MSLIPLRFPANYVGGIVPLALRAAFHLLSARVTIASGIIRLTLQTSLRSFSASLIIFFVTF